MYTHFINRWDAIRGSYWFLPGVMSLCGLLLAIACTSLAGPAEPWMVRSLPWIAVSASAARASLSAIAGAMVSIAGIVFSVMVVVLSITSSQYGSRLLRSFMSDRTTQFTLGTLVGTSLFCIVALAGIHNTGGRQFGNVSVIFGVLLAIVSMGMLIAFIHHISSQIQAPNVIAAVAHDLDAAIDRLFPENWGEEQPRQASDNVKLPPANAGIVIPSSKEGYLQAIDEEGIFRLAEKHDGIVQILHKPGEFVHRGQTLVMLWPRGDADVETIGDEANEPFIVGHRRTPRQDAECAINELVEVAVRALSPGINDPFTAIACIDRLAAALGRAAERTMPSPYRYSDQGQLRVVAPTTTFADLMNAAFNQIRQYGCQSVAVSIHLLLGLARIAEHTLTVPQQDEVERHANMLERDFRRHIEQPEDGDDFQHHRDRLTEMLRHSTARPEKVD